jgi:DNA primase
MVKEIRNKPDIVQVMMKEGIQLHTAARGGLKCICPLHADSSPSMTVNTDKQVFYCFGCGEGGDVITFVKKLHGLSFREAILYLGIEQGDKPQVSNDELFRLARRQRFDAWVLRYRAILADSYRELSSFKEIRPTTEEEGWAIAELLEDLPSIKEKLDILSGKDNEPKIKLYEEATHGRV